MALNKLNHIFWEANKELNPVIRAKLMKIAVDVIIQAKVIPRDAITDVVFTGSLANYNFTKYSDIDLHIIVDSSKIDKNKALALQFFNHFKKNWNETHEILIKGHEVEIYLQDITEEHKSTGIYSILTNKWLVKPRPMSTIHTNRAIIKKKYMFIKDLILDIKQEYLAGSVDYDGLYKKAEKLKNKILKFRNNGLLKHKELSNENLVYKNLRNKGYINLLFKIMNRSYDKIFLESVEYDILLESVKKVENRKVWQRNTIGGSNKKQTAVADLHKSRNERNFKVEELKKKDIGLYILNHLDLSQITRDYNISDLTPENPKKLGSTGIWIKYNPTYRCYYAQKRGTNRKKGPSKTIVAKDKI